MPRRLRFCGAVILHTIVAILGTAILESAIWKAFRAHSLAAILWKEWILSLLCAAFIGFFMWRTWRGSAALWAWMLPGLWFAFMFLLALPASQNPSALVGGGLWTQFSGAACDSGPRALGCRNFFVITIPFVRGVAYSAGACLSSWVNKPKSQPASESLSDTRQSAS
jgi:hypothetical protein